jgi:hypothetical protein
MNKPGNRRTSKKNAPQTEVETLALPSDPVPSTTDTLNDTQISQESIMDTNALDVQNAISDARPATIDKADVLGVSITPMRSGKHTAYAIVALVKSGVAAGLNGLTNDLWLNGASYTLGNGVSFDLVTYRRVIYSAEKAMNAVSDLIPGYYPPNETISETTGVVEVKAPLSDEDAALARAVVALIKLGKSEADARARIGYTGDLPRFRVAKAASVEAESVEAESSEAESNEASDI